MSGKDSIVFSEMSMPDILRKEVREEVDIISAFKLTSIIRMKTMIFST